MENRSFGALFGPYLSSGQALQALFGGIVESMDMDHSSRCMEVVVRFDAPVETTLLHQAEVDLAQSLRISGVFIHPVYAPELFSAEACAMLIPFLKKENVAVNGTFEDAHFALDGDELRVELVHGGLNILEATGAVRQLQQLIYRQYGRTVAVRFVGEAETQKDERYQKMMEQADQEAAQRAKEAAEALAAAMAAQPKAATESEPARPGKPADPTRPPADGLPIYLETAQPVIGTPIKDRPVPIKGLEADGSVVTVWGQIFRIDSRENRDATKCRYSISITDLTGSVILSLWLDKKRDKDTINAVSGLKKGDNLVVSGRYDYDEFAKGNLLRPRSVSIVARYQRQDLAPEKRVELHMHTKMSSMDAVAEAADLVKKAASWGHKAVAITDHGVVQAFPDIMNAAADLKKAGKPIKILYGMEAYFVNDMVPAVNGDADGPLDSEYIVFDIETTGLSNKTERITEIGAVRMVGGEVKESFNTFANPGKPIPAKIVELTGITDAMVADAPSEAEALRAFTIFAAIVACWLLTMPALIPDSFVLRLSVVVCRMSLLRLTRFPCAALCIRD